MAYLNLPCIPTLVGHPFSMPKITPPPSTSKRSSPYTPSPPTSPVRQSPTSAGMQSGAGSSSSRPDDDSMSHGQNPVPEDAKGSSAASVSPQARNNGLSARQWSRREKAPRTPEQEAARAETKARNAMAKLEHAAASKLSEARSVATAMPNAQRATVHEALLSSYMMNMNHYALDEHGDKKVGPNVSHGHDKAVRFAAYGYTVVEEGESGPSEAMKKSMALFISQVKEVAANNPAKLVLNENMHDEKMSKAAAQGEATYPFKGDKYSIDGIVTTPSRARKVLRTGWQMRQQDGAEDRTPVLLSAYLK